MGKPEKEDQFVTSLKILNRIGASILSEYTIAEMIDTVYEHVNELMDAYSFAIGIYNPLSQKIEYKGAREDNRLLPEFSIDANDPGRFSGWVFTNRSELLINDYETEYSLYLPLPITPRQGIQPASLMYAPLMSYREILGLISVRTLQKNAYNAQSLEILKTLSVFITRAIENARARAGMNRTQRKLPNSYILDPLSARELEVLGLLSVGLTNRAISQRLYISASTVKTHTLNIYKKLEIANRTEAMIKARTYGLIE